MKSTPPPSNPDPPPRPSTVGQQTDPHYVLEKPISRRQFLFWLGLGWAAVLSSFGLLALAFQRFLFPNVLREAPSKIKIGYPHDFAQDRMDGRFYNQWGIWVFRGHDPITKKYGMYALSNVCTHLGCTVDWQESDQKFKCPCHGSGFSKAGLHQEGPAPRPLERYGISLAFDGQVVVDKQRKYYFERGDWYRPDAFLELTG